ncbi:MAG TPA: hypothetical protein VF462_03320 [Micromonosporaceae bacterium]
MLDRDLAIAAAQPLHTGAGGLLVASDQETHAALLALIGSQFPPHVPSR